MSQLIIANAAHCKAIYHAILIPHKGLCIYTWPYRIFAHPGNPRRGIGKGKRIVFFFKGSDAVFVCGKTGLSLLKLKLYAVIGYVEVFFIKTDYLYGAVEVAFIGRVNTVSVRSMGIFNADAFNLAYCTVSRIMV